MSGGKTTMALAARPGFIDVVVNKSLCCPGFICRQMSFLLSVTDRTCAQLRQRH